MPETVYASHHSDRNDTLLLIAYRKGIIAPGGNQTLPQSRMGQGGLDQNFVERMDIL
jgi:hypothetical protein